jgi:hypothetical protein
MFSIYIDHGTWRITLSDGRTLTGCCETTGEALRVATATATRLEAARKLLHGR